jgi:hypothetical protein
MMATMWYLTKEESQAWCEEHALSVNRAAHPIINNRAHSITTSISAISWTRLTGLSGFIASYLEPFDECLLWVTLSGVWGSSENLHLYYRVRESYGDRRQLAAAPGHLFAKHEGADLATFIQLALIFGWDFYLLTFPAYHTAFVSHDEFIEFYTDDPDAAEKARHCLDAKPGTPAGKLK